MNFLKQYWFGLLIGLIIFWFSSFMLIVAFAPHYDEKGRGFSACTAQMGDEIESCSQEKSFFCTVGAVLHGATCDVEVIAQRLSQWLQGKQARPWSNYYFTPELQVEQEEYLDGQEDYQKQNPDMREIMRQLKTMKEDI